MPKPKRSFWAPPRPKNDPIGPQKAQNDPKNKAKKIQIEIYQYIWIQALMQPQNSPVRLI